MTFALFGIENDGLNLAVNLLVFFLVVIWVALVYWTYADANRRLDDPLLIGCATVASLFPFIGTIVYAIVRPPEYLEDARERDLEVKAAEKRLALLENRTCRNCGSEIEPSFLRCPSCMRKLKEPCRSCGRPLDPRWRVCPYCEAEVSSSVREPRSERRRRARPDADRQPRVTRGAGERSSSERAAERPSYDRTATTPARGEETIAEPTASGRGERGLSQPPPDR
jgi:Double zinc ribbon